MNIFFFVIIGFRFWLVPVVVVQRHVHVERNGRASFFALSFLAFACFSDEFSVFARTAIIHYNFITQTYLPTRATHNKSTWIPVGVCPQLRVAPWSIYLLRSGDEKCCQSKASGDHFSCKLILPHKFYLVDCIDVCGILWRFYKLAHQLISHVIAIDSSIISASRRQNLI